MILTNAKIFTMSASGIINNGFIEICNGKITRIGDMCSYAKKPDDIVKDLSGMCVTPGFIDAHTHLGICEEGISFEGDDCNEETDPVTPHLRAIDAINPMDSAFGESLRAGITTALVAPGSANPIGGQIAAIKTHGRRIDDMIIKAPVAFKFALGENPKIVYHDKNQSPMTRMATAAVIRETLFKAKEYMQNSENSSEGQDCDDDDHTPPDFDIKLSSLVPLLKGEVPAHFHAHRADDIFTAIRIAKEFNLNYVIIHATEAHIIADELEKEHAKLICGPILSDKLKPELVNLAAENLGIVAKHNIPMCICTDHPVFPLKYLSVCASIAVREGLDEYDALKAITINPAEICGISDRVGSLEIGKDADIIIFDGNPLDYRTKINTVIADGEIVYA